jgi:DNA-binding MarR family transcriptional regulator
VKSLHNDSTAITSARSQALERLWSLALLLGHGMQQGLAERGLTLARANLIWELQENSPCTQRALSSALRVTPRNVTGLVDALEADGLVERAAHPSDRRATLVTLTEQGKDLAATLRREQDGFAQYLFADASSGELESFVAMLDQVLGRVRAVMPSEDAAD